jgi:acyl-CoA reductase-like NAD-dependent aldehyde dehydrogenase
MRIAPEEIFGPVLTVIAYRDEDDAVRIANDSEYGLAGSVFTTDVERGLGIAARVRAGRSGSTRATSWIPSPRSAGSSKVVTESIGLVFGRFGVVKWNVTPKVTTPW